MSDSRPYGTEFNAINQINMGWTGSLVTGTTVYGWLGLLFPTREMTERVARKLIRHLNWVTLLAMYVTTLGVSADMVLNFGEHELIFVDLPAVGFVLLLMWCSDQLDRTIHKSIAIDEYRVVRGGGFRVRLIRLGTTVSRPERL